MCAPAQDEPDAAPGHIETELEQQAKAIALAKRRFITRSFKYSQKEKQIFKTREDKVKHGRKMRKRESMIMRLKEKVNFTVEDLQNMIKGFKLADQDENKFIDFEEFKKAMGMILGDDTFDNYGDGNSKNYFSQVFFQAFDTNNSGYIDFGEMCMGLSAYLDGTMSERLAFLFRVYDVNGDGKITRGEVATMLKHQWNHVSAHQTATGDVERDSENSDKQEDHGPMFRKSSTIARQLVEYASFEDYLKESIKRFDKLDKDGDHKIDLQEFSDGIQHDDSLFELFATDMFLLPKDPKGENTVGPSLNFIETKVKNLEKDMKNPVALHNQILLYMKVLEVEVSKKNLVSMINVTRTIDSLFGERVLKADFHKEFTQALKTIGGETNSHIDFDVIVDRFLPDQIKRGIAYCKTKYFSTSPPPEEDVGEEARESTSEEKGRLLAKREQVTNKST